MIKSGSMRTRPTTVFFLFFLLSPLWGQDLLNPSTVVPPSQEDLDQFNSTLLKAKRGDAKAMGILGLMYEKGLSCARDQGKGIKWLKKGAQKGDAAAQNNLGFAYLNGWGVKEDDTEALKWFQKAAAQGLASAQTNLGLLYGRGLGVSKDYAKALSWFKLAAEQDDPDAQVNLAQMLSLGEGAKKDYIESYKWFCLALRDHNLKDEQVADLRDDIEWLEKHMKGDEIKEAQARADNWKPAFPENNP